MTIYTITGWHSVASATKEDIKEPTADCVKGYNAMRIAGYLPVLGILVGVVDIMIGKVGAQKEMGLATRVYAIVRGILEILGLGILFLIPDAAVSIHRHFCVGAPAKKI